MTGISQGGWGSPTVVSDPTSNGGIPEGERGSPEPDEYLEESPKLATVFANDQKQTG